MPARDPHALIEELLLAADHEVAAEVGAEPGTIVRTARPREGLVRPKVVWTVLREWPASLDAVFEELEGLRKGAGADRAIGMLDGSPPEGRAGAVKRGSLDVMTIRRFAFELANVEPHLEDLRSFFQKRIGAFFVPRLLETEDGQTKDAVTSIIEWTQKAKADDLLWLVGPEGSGRSAVVTAAAATIADRFFEAPDTTRPLLSAASFSRPDLLEILREQGWAVYGDTQQDVKRYVIELDLPYLSGGIRKIGSWSMAEGLFNNVSDRSTAWRLEELDARSVLKELGKQAPGHESALQRVVSAAPDLQALLKSPRSLPRWLAAITDNWHVDFDSEAEAAARLVASLVSEVTNEWDDILDWALEDFALGHCAIEDEVFDLDLSTALNSIKEKLGWVTISDKRFDSTLVRDYFLAHKIIAEVRAGRPEILTRHQFPREFVLLFLAILSPEVAALASEDRSKTMHAEISAEVEREVQLALAHNLRHPVSFIRSALSDIRKRLPGDEQNRIAGELSRIEDATRHISALVDKTSQWSQIPEERFEALSIALVVQRALEPLRREWPDVDVILEVGTETRVHAGPVTLQTILSNLLENAFHAVAQNGPERRVIIRASRTGETWRIEVTDSGPGVHPDDRERIFEPRVTTKKGGRGKPRGTGMGLPIALRYARHIGGRVWLDANAPQTTFVLELVPAREVPDDR